VCRELLSDTDLPTVLQAVLGHIGERLGSEIAYLRVIDHVQSNDVIESARGMASRELEGLRAWLDQRGGKQRAHGAGRREATGANFDRFPIDGQPGIEGVLVLDRRDADGPGAFDDHSVILAVTGLLADAVHFRRDQLQRPPDTQSPALEVPHPACPESYALNLGSGDEPTARRSLKDRVFAFEREVLVEALGAAGGNISRAARALRTTPRVLTYRLRRHGLHSGGRKPGG